MSTTTIATETIQYGRLTLNTSSDLIDAHSAHTQADTLEEELTRVIPGGEVDPNWGMPGEIQQTNKRLLLTVRKLAYIS